MLNSRKGFGTYADGRAPDDPKRKHTGHRDARCVSTPSGVRRYAQLEPTAESVLDMLLPAVCTFWPWLFACS
jgi:hypothetical protein